MEIARRSGRPCTVCQHPKRAEIEARMLDGAISRVVEQEFDNVLWGAIERHCERHVSLAVKQAAEVVTGEPLRVSESNRARGGSIFDKLWDTEALLDWGMTNAKDRKKLIPLAQIGAQRRATLETLAKLYMQLAHPPEEIDKAREKDWAQFQYLVTTALRNYPEARAALGEAILRVKGELPTGDDEDSD